LHYADIAIVENRTRQGIFSADIAVVENDIRWKLQSIRRSPYLQKCYTTSIKNKQLRILKMATCFIAYVPKPTKEKHIIKSAIESEFLIQKANRDDGIMVEGTLTHYISRC
jgi:hypothetical protein